MEKRRRRKELEMRFMIRFLQTGDFVNEQRDV
jgi:hypothetical protein